MLSRPKDYQEELQPLLEEAYEIGHAKDMALAPEYSQALRRQGYGQRHAAKWAQKSRVIEGIPAWLSKLEVKFNELGLNYRKFVAEYNLLKPANVKTLHLGERFNFAFQVLKRIMEDQEYLLNYLGSDDRAKIESSLDGVAYAGGVVSFGELKHSFNNADYIALFNFLWPVKKVIDRTGKVEEGNPRSKGQIKSATGINNERLKDMAVNVRKELYDRGIPVKLKRPDKIYLEVDLQPPGN